MNSKKALQELMNGFGFGVIGRSLCEIIEKDLDRLEDLEDNHEVVLNTLEDATNQLEKYKKAIEILKNKDIDMEELLKSNNVDEYNKRSFKADILTQQEYELLKEAFEQ